TFVVTRSSNEPAERSTMSLAPKLDRARQDLEYWQKIAEDSKLSPHGGKYSARPCAVLPGGGDTVREGVRLSGTEPPGAHSTNAGRIAASGHPGAGRPHAPPSSLP